MTAYGGESNQQATRRMQEAANRPRGWRRGLLFCVTPLVLAAIFCGWVFRARTHRTLNKELIFAVKNSDTVTVSQLLARGADPNIRDVPQPYTSLWQQIKLSFFPEKGRGEDEFITLLEEAMDPDNCSDCKSGSENVSLVRALLAAGARVEDQSFAPMSSVRETPLIWAVSRNQPKTVQLLLDYGANPIACDDSGQIPLHRTHDLKIAALLFKLGNDVNAVDVEGKTPLMTTLSRDVTLSRFLIARGSDINARAKDGSSALIMATTRGYDEAAELLLAHGGEVNVCDMTGRTPLHAAVNCDEPFNHIAQDGNGVDFDPRHNVKLLLEHGAKVDAVDKNGDTPLTSCIAGETSPDLVEVLLAHGADVDHRNKAGQTPLSIAKKSNALEIVELLKAAGAKR